MYLSVLHVIVYLLACRHIQLSYDSDSGFSIVSILTPFLFNQIEHFIIWFGDEIIFGQIMKIVLIILIKRFYTRNNNYVISGAMSSYLSEAI